MHWGLLKHDLVSIVIDSLLTEPVKIISTFQLFNDMKMKTMKCGQFKKKATGFLMYFAIRIYFEAASSELPVFLGGKIKSWSSSFKIDNFKIHGAYNCVVEIL